MQVQRIDRAVAKGDLVVVGVIHRLRKRVRRMELIVIRETLVHGKEQRVVVGVDVRRQVFHRVRAADHGVIHRADGDA